MKWRKEPHCAIIGPMEEKKVIIAPGDGIGKEISSSMMKIIDKALEKYSKIRIDWEEVDLHKLDEAMLEKIKKARFAIKGPTTTPVGKGARSINVALRQQLDLYACVRPVSYFEGVPSPLKHPEDVDMVVFRENTEDLYSGIEWEEGSAECKKLIKFLKDEMKVTKIRFDKTSAIGIKNISREGTERLVRSAINYAIKTNRKTVTIIHKGNIMKFTEGGFRSWGYELAKREFKGEEKDGNVYLPGGIVVNSCIADNFFQQAILNPKKFSVVVCTNLNGDYVSDALAAEVGGIGYAPGANINYDTGVRVYEATHGSAPDIAGMNKANPMSITLSAVMMLESMDEEKAAKKVEEAIKTCVKNGFVTEDFYNIKRANGEEATLLSCSEFADKVISYL